MFGLEFVMIVYVFSRRIVGENWFGLKTAIEFLLNRESVVVGLQNDASYVVLPTS